LLSGFFSVLSYAQSNASSYNNLNHSTVSVDEDAMNREISYDFMETDVGARQSNCTEDTEPPIIFCPDDVEVFTEPHECIASATWDTPLVTDNCDNIVSVCSLYSGENFPVGITTVTCTAVDLSGNTATCEFTVTVRKTEPPFICIDDITVAAPPGTCSAVLTPPTVDPGCAFGYIGCDYPPGNEIPIGTTTVTCSALSLVSGDILSCSFDVTVIDNEPPELICPDDIEVLPEPYECVTTVTWDPPLVADNCDNIAVVCSFSPGDYFPTGTTTVTCVAVDLSGNMAECSFDVTVLYNHQPLNLTCPDDIEVSIASYECDAVVEWGGVPSFNATPCEFIVVHYSHDWGDLFPVGTTTVICSAQDALGYWEYCSFDVTVVHNQPPDVTCPSVINCLPAITFSNATVNGLYHAENSVTATNTITSGSDVNFKAGDVIQLNNEFTTPANINFSAEIENCTTDGNQN